jgi:hypothetical protein
MASVSSFAGRGSVLTFSARELLKSKGGVADRVGMQSARGAVPLSTDSEVLPLAARAAIRPITRLALEIHRAWSRHNPPPRASIVAALRDGGLAPIGAGALQAFTEGLENAAVKDHVALAGTTAAPTRRAPLSPLLTATSHRRWLAPGGWPTPLEFGLAWGAARLPHLQAVIEAFPLELMRAGVDDAGLLAAFKEVGRGASELEPYLEGDPGLSLAQALSCVFHTLVSDFYESIGCRYHAVRLYQDDLDTPAVGLALKNTQLVFPWEHSATIAARFPSMHHGIVVRVREPLVQIPDASAVSGCRWRGCLEYLAVASR